MRNVFSDAPKCGGGYKCTYEGLFYKSVSEKRLKARERDFEGKACHNFNGKQEIWGFPLTRGAWCNGRLKVGALERMQKNIRSSVLSDDSKKHKEQGANMGISVSERPMVQRKPKDGGNKVFYTNHESEVVRYIGIAADEGKRSQRHIEKMEQGLEMLPLVKAGWTEQMCRDWCEENGLLSPTYTTSTRGGCWFCHNQGIDQLRNLYHDYPELWQLLLKWDNDSPVTFHADGRTVHDFDRRFRWEDEGYKPTGKMFRWSDVENQQMNIYQFLDNEGA